MAYVMHVGLRAPGVRGGSSDCWHRSRWFTLRPNEPAVGTCLRRIIERRQLSGRLKSRVYRQVLFV